MEIEIIGVKVDQSYQWSFRPKSAWVSIEMTTIGEMHPTLRFNRLRMETINQKPKYTDIVPLESVGLSYLVRSVSDWIRT